jgi:biotin synthase-related radical SAM superfamily protein
MRVKAVVETVIYKKTSNLKVHADIYYPIKGEVLPERKTPVSAQ